MLTSCEFEDVWHEVVTLDDQVFNDSIKLRITVLHSGDGYILDAFKGSRKNDLAEILQQMRLESRLSVLIVAEVGEQLLHRFSELLVLNIPVELVGKKLSLVDNAISVVAVTVPEKEVSTVIERIPLVGSRVLHDITLLLQNLSDVLVNTLEPVLQFWVLVGILCTCQYCLDGLK